jgi:hypothetical protein
MAAERKKILLGTWEDVTGDRERDALICAIRAVEAREGERRGWDQKPRLMALLLPEVDSEAVHIDVVPTRLWAGGRNPVDGLISAATRVPVAPPDRSGGPIAFADSPGGFAGLAFMTEGWTAPPEATSAEEEARRAAGERTFAERPDRIEVRMVTCIDINGHLYQLNRIRDGKPELDVTDNAPLSGVGRLVQALQRLTVAVHTGAWAY